MGSASAPGTDSDPAVAATVRLLHRRRGWAWATVLSVVAWIVACGLLGSLDPNATGVWLAVSSILILLLTAVAVVSLVAAVADTVKLRRRDPGCASRRSGAPRTTRPGRTPTAIRRDTASPGCSAGS